jgi:F-type H+-transporting ATPase subunit delta
MKFSHKQYAQALHESLQDTSPKDHDKVIANFIDVLKNNGDLKDYEKIIKAYEDYDRQQRGVKEVEVTTARDIEVNKDMIRQLNAIAGSDAEVKRKVDGGLIGGVVVRVDDTLLDGSVKTQLNNLKKTLTH